MGLEEAIDICKAIKKNIRYESNFDLNILKLNRNNEEAIETVLQALDNSIPKEKVKAEIQKIENELEEKYSAEKISVFSGNTYMEKFKLLGKLEVLKELLEE